jgi:hypothetical protein
MREFSDLEREQFQQFLDREYPFIDQNAEPPGRWRDDDVPFPGKKWSGQMGWRTRHGNSVVRWNLGRPIYVSNALLSDNTRVDVQGSGGGPSRFRYRLTGEPRRWLHGEIDIQPDEVTFTPGEQPIYEPPPESDYANLEFDLAHAHDLRGLLSDERVADALYAYLQNGEFFKEGGDRIWQCGLSNTAGLVANLRGHGDTYTDYYPHGPSEPTLPTHTDEIIKKLTALGWRKATAGDRAVAAEATRREIASWEMRPEASIPDWAAEFQAAAVRDPRFLDRHHRGEQLELMRRLHVLAVSGRISESEFRSTLARIYVVPNSPASRIVAF